MTLKGQGMLSIAVELVGAVLSWGLDEALLVGMAMEAVLALLLCLGCWVYLLV